MTKYKLIIEYQDDTYTEIKDLTQAETRRIIDKANEKGSGTLVVEKGKNLVLINLNFMKQIINEEYEEDK